MTTTLSFPSTRAESLEPFRFTPFDSFLYAEDILGYSFLSLATLYPTDRAAAAKPTAAHARVNCSSLLCGLAR